VGFEGQVTIVLWCMRLIVAGDALFSLQHQKSIRRHAQKFQGWLSVNEYESLPGESSVDKGPADEEEIGVHRDRWTLNLTAPNQRNKAHRHSRRGLGETLDVTRSPGDPGKWQDQEIWEWKDRAECISVKELMVIRMLLMETM
jgi:hypothetical protein